MRTLLLFLLITAIQTVNAQTGYVPGFILTKENDTIQGYIKKQNDRANIAKCMFKKDLDAKMVNEYLPNDILGYRYDEGKYYTSKSFKLNDQDTTVFAEYLVDGELNLHYIRFDDKERYLMIKEDKDTVLLEGFEDIKRNGEVYRSNARSVGQLKYLMNDARKIYGDIEKISFNQKDMIELSTDYHQIVCPDEECIVYKKSDVSLKFGLGVVSAVRLSNYKFESVENPFRYQPDKDSYTSIGYSFGVNFYSTVPFINENLLGNLYYLGSNYEINVSQSNHYNTEAFTANFIANSIGFEIGYIVVDKRIMIYPSIGANYTFLTNIKYDIIESSEYLSSDLRLKNFFGSVTGGINTLFELNDKYAIKADLVLELTTDYEKIRELQTSINNYYLKIGLVKTFKKDLL